MIYYQTQITGIAMVVKTQQAIQFATATAAVPAQRIITMLCK
jgi:hypothetical protein